MVKSGKWKDRRAVEGRWSIWRVFYTIRTRSHSEIPLFEGSLSRNRLAVPLFYAETPRDSTARLCNSIAIVIDFADSADRRIPLTGTVNISVGRR